MKLKRIMASILALCMVLRTMSFAVFATELDYVAKIGETEYADFATAMTAANAETGAVEVEIYGEVEFTDGMELKNGSYESITFTGMADGATITINQSAGGDYLEAHGKTVDFTNLTLAKANPAWSGNSGHMGNYFSIQGGTVTYNNCTFPNGACTSGGTATYNECTFENTSEYGLWVYDDAIVTVEGGTINSAKGIKVYSEGEDSVTSELTVKNATFTENVTAKPAIAIGYAVSIELIGNTYNNSTAVIELDSGSDANCNGIAFVAEDADGNDITSDLTVVDRSKSGATCGAFVTNSNGTAIYTTATTAAEAAQAGDTVTLLYDTEEDVTFAEGVTLDTNGYTAENVKVEGNTSTTAAAKIGEQGYETLKDAIDAVQNGETIVLTADCAETVHINKSGVAFTIDGANKTYTGKIEINVGQNVTIKNINFVHEDDAKLDFIANVGSPTGKNYNTTMTVEDCTFTGNGKDNVVAIRTIHPTAITVKNCEGTGLHSFLQNTGGQKVEVRNVTITESKGGLAVGTTPSVTVRDCDITTRTYGIRLDATLDANVTLNGNTINAYIPVSVRKATAENYKLNFNGSASSYTATNADGVWCAICATEYEEGVALNDATGNVKITWNTDVLDKSGVYGAYEWPIEVVYGDGYTRGFDSLSSAMSLGYSGSDEKTIIVHEDITEEMDSLEGNITTDNPNGVTIKNTIVDEWIYCSEDFTIGEGVTYDATGYNSGLFMYAKNAVINGTVVTDCYYQRYADTKLTINEPGSMTVKTETFILRYTDSDADAGVYVVGDSDDSTIGLNASVIYFYQGMINAKDANIKVGTYWQTNETDDAGTANLVLDNSKMTVTVNEHKMKATGNSTVTLTNGSSIDVAGGYEGVKPTLDKTSSVTKGDETLYPVAPKGSNSPAYTKEADGYVRVWGQSENTNAAESYVLKLYANDTLIATTVLNNVGNIIDGSQDSVTWNFYYPNSNDEYWTTTWEEGHPNSAAQPTKVELYIDGTLVDTTDAQMNGADNLNPVVWAELGGVKKVIAGLSGSGTAEDPFLINDIDELKWFRDNVNNGNSYSGKYVKVTATEIDLSILEENWTPIGTSSNSFQGHFDGNNVIIKNLVVDMGKTSNAGFFGFTQNGSVTNIEFKNATVTGRLNVGIVAGTPYTSKYDNIKITGHVEVNGLAYVGGAFGKNVYADVSNITIDVDETSYVKAVSTENGTNYRTYVGGVIGFMGEGNHKVSNVTSNINVSGNVRDVGGITGIAHYGNVFENITCTGNVENTNTDEAGLAETGAIAGVWHNEKGYVVTFTNCKYEGPSNVALVGAAYTSNNDSAETSGSLVIDGETAWPKPIKVTYADDKVEYFGDMLDAVPYTTNCPRLEGATITLLDNVSGQGMRFMENDMVFDLNGFIFTITAGTGSQGTNTSGFQIRPEVTTNVTFKNGTINVQDGAPVVWMFNCYATDFIVENVTVDCANMAWSYGNSCYAAVSRPGDNIQLKGSTEIINFNSDVAGDAYSIGGTMEVGDEVVLGGRIQLDKDASLKAGENVDVVATEDCVIKYEDGVYTAVEKVSVATVTDSEGNVTSYTDIQVALDAAAAGTGNVTVEILENIDLTNVDWNPVTVSALGYPVVTVNGNNKTITGLNDMLFAGTWAGGSGLIINDLTIADSDIVNDENDTKGTVGVGAFIGFPQASSTITLNNCHLVNSTVNGGHWTGGLIGYAAGYAGNDGPVFMNLNITGCSVTGSTITGKGSAGGIIGHGSGNGWTNVVIENTTVSGNTITSTGSSTNKAGAIMGTIGAAGQPTTANGETKTGAASVSATVSGNTVTSGGTTITTIYGRQGTSTGMLYITGGNYDKYPIEENVAYAQPKEGYEIVQNDDGTYGITEKAELFGFSMNLDLESSMTVNFYVPTSELKGTDYYAKIVHIAENDEEFTRIVNFEEWIDNGDSKQISYKDLYARNMADSITITVYDGMGKPVSKTTTTSIKDYAKKYIEAMAGSGDKWVTSFVDMLNYGAEAQKRFSYNVENLANADIADYQDYATQEDVELEENIVTNGPVYGTNLDLENSIVFNGYFENVTDDMYAEINYTNHMKNPVSDEAELVPNGDYHQVTVDSLMIADANQMITITVKNKDGSVHASVEESVNGYLCRAIAAKPEFAPLARAMAKFTASAHTALHAK